MQRNCHEFIAYENLVGSRRGRRSRTARAGRSSAQAPIEQVVPLVRRALKVLSDREVSPQLGLLKSTLLQLDSTFSERTYGVGSFRDFAQKLAAAGHVPLRETGRNVLVELADGNGASAQRRYGARRSRSRVRDARNRRDAPPRDAVRTSREPQQVDRRIRRRGGEPRAADGIREVRRLFQAAPNPPRWPMYVRQAKQFMRNVDPTFDERKFGFGSLMDLLRACQRDGLFRIERDRQGVMRLFPGNIMQPSTGADDPEEDVQRDVIEAPVAESAQGWRTRRGAAVEAESRRPHGAAATRRRRRTAAEVVDGDVVQEMEVAAGRRRRRGACRAEEAEARPRHAQARRRSRAPRRRPKARHRARARRAREVARRHAPRKTAGES